MQIISHEQINKLDISPSTCVDWVKQSFSIKEQSQLPAKISVHPQGDDFFTSMPCLLPSSFSRFGIKIVHRISNACPTLGSDILLYDSKGGELLALLDGNWITTMRTGAVATLAIQTFQSTNAKNYSFIGLGNTARATLLCLLDCNKEKEFNILLLQYKDQAQSFIERFKNYPNLKFTVFNDVQELINQSDVIISSVTCAQDLICPNNESYRKGCLIIPIHTRGFQNCDLFFDKIYGDDTDHVKGFRYFSRFKQYNEFKDVLLNKIAGRENNNERIISYNIGLGLHDILFASKIYDKISDKTSEINLEKVHSKFWI